MEWVIVLILLNTKNSFRHFTGQQSHNVYLWYEKTNLFWGNISKFINYKLIAATKITWATF